MNSHDICVVTSTFYPSVEGNDLVRSELALSLLSEIDEHGFQGVVVDGGSLPDFIEKMGGSRSKIFSGEQLGRGEGRRKAIEEALLLHPKYIVYVDPEKVDFIRSISLIAERMENESLDMVIPRRRSMSSYPRFQEYSEKFMNEYLGALSGHSFDYVFGPRMWKQEHSHYFLTYDGKYGDTWDAIFIPVFEMLKNVEMKVGEVIVDFDYPPSQKAFEEQGFDFYQKRLAQVKNVLDAAYDYYTI